MPKETINLPPPVNHIFVDYENVHTIDPTIIGKKTVHVTLLLGAKTTKLDAAVVEKFIQHAATVELIRLASSGRNALDFALAYYLGRAVAADPTGHFHIVSKDTGYDPLIAHLQSERIRAHRHDSFATLPFAAPASLPTPKPPAVASKPKSRSKPKGQVSIADERTALVLEHLRRPSSTRPKNRKKLVSFLIAYFGHKIDESEALNVVENLCRAGHLAIDGKGKVSYHLDEASAGDVVRLKTL